MKDAAIAFLLVLVAAGAGFIVLGKWNAEPGDSVVVETAALREELAESETDRARLRDELSAAENRIVELEASAAMNAETMSNEPDVETIEPAEPTPEDAEEAKNELSLNDIRARIRENATAQAQLKGLSELMYADFLNGVELDADTKAEVRRLLSESFIEGMALNQYALQGSEATWADVRAWTLQERGILDEELRGQLSDEAYATWSDYAADLDVRQLDGTLRNQIRALASGLTPENFEMVMQVAVQEFRAEQIALEQSDALFTLEENIHYQLRAMDAMREQLQGALSEDQFAELENFLTFGENALNGQLEQMGQTQ